MCIRDRNSGVLVERYEALKFPVVFEAPKLGHNVWQTTYEAVSYTHLRAHETVLDLVCRLLLEKKKNNQTDRTCVYEKINDITRYQ